MPGRSCGVPLAPCSSLPTPGAPVSDGRRRAKASTRRAAGQRRHSGRGHPAGTQEAARESLTAAAVRPGWGSRAAAGKPASSAVLREGPRGPTGPTSSLPPVFCIPLPFPHGGTLTTFAGVKFSCLDSISAYRACRTCSLEIQRRFLATLSPHVTVSSYYTAAALLRKQKRI